MPILPIFIYISEYLTYFTPIYSRRIPKILFLFDFQVIATSVVLILAVIPLAVTLYRMLLEYSDFLLVLSLLHLYALTGSSVGSSSNSILLTRLP
jgi:hypothetical protein